MDALKIFANLTNRSFSAQVSGLIKSGPKQIEQFKILCANAIARTIETNDITHVNRMVTAALACGRYRTFARVVPGCVPFKWSGKDRAFSGKRQKGSYKKLMAVDSNGSYHFENLLVEYFGKEDTFGKTTPAKQWDMDEAVLRLVKKARSEGKSFAALNKAVEKAEIEIAAA